MEKQSPDGVIAILVSADGRVMASASDFDRGGYGGYKLHEAQRLRARKMLAINFARDYCSPAFLEGVETYDLEKVVRALVQKGKAREHIELIGHPDVDRRET